MSSSDVQLWVHAINHLNKVFFKSDLLKHESDLYLEFDVSLNVVISKRGQVFSTTIHFGTMLLCLPFFLYKGLYCLGICLINKFFLFVILIHKHSFDYKS
jgi:hypothetical protein